MGTKPFILVLAAVSILISCGTTKGETEWPEVKTEHKPFTRWWWLGSAVDKENLTYNMELYSKAGIGGVEITPIYGVQGEESRDIEYLSPKWLEMYAYTQSEAKRLGMIVDMNNGTGWPFGNPYVTTDDAATKVIIQKYELKGGTSLKETITVNDPKQKEVAKLNCLMAYGPNGDKMNITDKISDNGTLQWTALEGNWTIYAVFQGKTFLVVERAAPGGEGYVIDHFNKDALGCYLKRFDDAFAGKNLPMPRAFFNDSYEVDRADWTPAFLGEFAQRRGYKLEEYLPEFAANDSTEMSQRVVSDYRLTIHEMLMDNFISPWIAWTHKQGSLVRNQSHGSPGNLLDIYASVDIPECETFGRTRFDIPMLEVDSGMRLNDSNPAVLKLASSAAHITGKNLTSAETFTWLTEHFRTALSQCKPEIDQMFASGVNHVFFHGTPYSPKDAEWPGWLFYASVNMSPTNPTWRDANAFFTYITRCQSFLQEGNADNDFLLYMPMYDFWNDIRRTPFLMFTIHVMAQLVPEFNQTVAEIMDSGYDLDYISDQFISSLKFENGELVTSGGARYKALIIPSSRLMPEETLAKIVELTKQGAKIVFANRYPEDVPGLSNLEQRRGKMKTIMAELPVASFDQVSTYPMGKGEIITGSDYRELLPATGITGESFKKDFGGQYTRRSYKDGYIYFMTMLQNRPVDGWVTLEKPAKSVMLFDPMTGNKGLARIRTENGKTQVYLQLRPDESVILKTFTDKTIKTENWKYLAPASTPVNLTNGWSLSFVESEPAIKGTFAIDTLCSWTCIADENATKNMGTALYRTTFTLQENTAADWELNLGEVKESARVRINGKDVGTIYAIPYTARVGQYLKPGENTIEVEVTNLPANRIADYDRRGVEWRKFKEINFVNIFYKKVKYDNWEIEPSGLIGPVTLTPMNPKFQ